MRALVWTKPKVMEVRETEPPKPKPGEVLIRVSKVGICGSEIQGYMGSNSLRRPPLVMGHEFAGTVIDPGKAKIPVGTKVTVNPLLTCGTCSYCMSGRDNLCVKRNIIGVHRPGAFAEFVTVPEGAVHPLPNGVSDVEGSLTEPVAVAIRAVSLGNVNPGCHLVIFGFGFIGLATLWAARAAGVENITVVDVNEFRLQEAERQGASEVLDARKTNILEWAGRLDAGSRPQVAIDAVGSSIVRSQACEVVIPGGTVVFVGLHEVESALPCNDMVRRELTVRGCFCYSKKDFLAALDLLRCGQYRAGSWLQEWPLSDGIAAFEALLNPQVKALKIVLDV